jgi:hypothetical protein
MRHGRLGDVEGAADFTAAQLAAFGDGAQDAQPGPVGERFGDAYELLIVHVRAVAAPLPRTPAAKMFRYLSY